jgi:hypothetical protein
MWLQNKPPKMLCNSCSEFVEREFKGPLSLNPAHEEDQTNKPIKRFVLELIPGTCNAVYVQ